MGPHGKFDVMEMPRSILGDGRMQWRFWASSEILGTHSRLFFIAKKCYISPQREQPRCGPGRLSKRPELFFFPTCCFFWSSSLFFSSSLLFFFSWLDGQPPKILSLWHLIKLFFWEQYGQREAGPEKKKKALRFRGLKLKNKSFLVSFGFQVGIARHLDFLHQTGVPWKVSPRLEECVTHTSPNKILKFSQIVPMVSLCFVPIVLDAAGCVMLGDTAKGTI